MPRPRYNGATTCLVWVVGGVIGITFWLGVICLAARLYNSYYSA